MLRSLINTLRFIIKHPLNKGNKTIAVFRYFKWQLISCLNPIPVVYLFASKSKMLFWKGLRGATGNLYCGLHEFEDMAFLLHFLRAEDQFVDIGANVGSYTLLAANEVGAKTIAIEPGKSAYNTLKKNISLNDLKADRIRILNIALGAKKSSVKLTRSLGTENHIATGSESDIHHIEMETFDEIIDTSSKLTFVKIDVEGYEMEVLKGMTKALESDLLMGLIIELNGLTNQYGCSPEQIHELLRIHQFQSYTYLPFERILIPIESHGDHNTIYLRDLNFATERVIAAPKLTIHRKEI